MKHDNRKLNYEHKHNFKNSNSCKIIAPAGSHSNLAVRKQGAEILGTFNSTINSKTFETGASGTEISLKSFGKIRNC